MLTNRSDLLALHGVMCRAANELMVKKNHDYAGEGGDDAFANFRLCEAAGLLDTPGGVLVRIFDKIKRLVTYSQCGRLAVSDEGVRDTCLDIINYVVIFYGLTLENHPEPARPTAEDIGADSVPDAYVTERLRARVEELRRRGEHMAHMDLNFKPAPSVQQDSAEAAPSGGLVDAVQAAYDSHARNLAAELKEAHTK